MAGDPTVARQLAIDFVARSRALLWPYLLRPSRFEGELAGIVGHHREDNEAYRVDQLIDGLLSDLLAEYRIAGRVFSEESGWRSVGDGDDYTIVCDPFDNSFLATRSFRDSAVVISIGDSRGGFLSCAVGDLATKALYLADHTGAHVLEEEEGTWHERPAATSLVTRIDDAFVILPAILRPERTRAVDVPELLGKAKHLLTLDGAIFFGRLAAGYVDAYVDVVVGQPVYEVTCLEMIIRAGGVVTDIDGELLDFSRVLAMVREDPEGRTSVVAAATPELHDNLLQALHA